MINNNTAIILSTKVLNLNIDATVYANRSFHLIYISVGVVNHDH